ncbi:MAG: alpha-1,2-fucosyltransferase [Proteobacteria bacterium]|nr:alpha-1,2-fucosyltransferase [Pseudomonadota bacterium]
MIIVRIMGGLGNQMFQFAAGRQLAARHKTVVKMDISDFENYNLHDYGLSVFNINELFASKEEINLLKEPEAGTWKKRIKKVLRCPNKLGKTHIKEKHYHFDPEILSLSDFVYLDGYWQSEKYFLDIADVIRNEFTITLSQTDENSALTQQINSCESVSLHVRRGDYVTDEKTKTIHGTCGLDYYRRCIADLSQKVPHPCFFIFSDDPEWTKQNLKITHPATFISHNGPEKNYEDLRLMSQCRHHIIANSSFSWWGAWLGQYPDKLVLSPSGWFKEKTFNTKDLIPSTWQRL